MAFSARFVRKEKVSPGLRTIIEHIYNNLNASKTSSEHLMMLNLRTVSRTVYIYLIKMHVKRHPCNYMFRVNNKNPKTRCKIYSKLTIKTEQRQWRRSGVFILNFEHNISHLVLLFLLLILSR